MENYWEWIKQIYERDIKELQEDILSIKYGGKIVQIALTPGFRQALEEHFNCKRLEEMELFNGISITEMPKFWSINGYPTYEIFYSGV